MVLAVSGALTCAPGVSAFFRSPRRLANPQAFLPVTGGAEFLRDEYVRSMDSLVSRRSVVLGSIAYGQ